MILNSTHIFNIDIKSFSNTAIATALEIILTSQDLRCKNCGYVICPHPEIVPFDLLFTKPGRL